MTSHMPASKLIVACHADQGLLGVAAADRAATIIRSALEKNGRARILLAAANSQRETIAALVQRTEIDWSKVEAFHLDEYIGIPAEHPASFRLWIRKHFAEKARPGLMRYLEGDALDLDVELDRYARDLFSAPVDLAFVGFGENGHIAFNDPPTAEFDDPLLLKRVQLDHACRMQQVGEGHFLDLATVPREAVTVTCSGLMRALHWVCAVPDARKARAVRAALEGPVTPRCPASLVRRHPRAFVFLDIASASLLERQRWFD